nr:MAG TPA: hypothetical protein [Caudoviricetes sp.]
MQRGCGTEGQRHDKKRIETLPVLWKHCTCQHAKAKRKTEIFYCLRECRKRMYSIGALGIWMFLCHERRCNRSVE